MKLHKKPDKKKAKRKDSVKHMKERIKKRKLK